MGLLHVGECGLRGRIDEDLVDRAKAGCTETTEYLLRKYRGLVEGKARAFFLAGAEREDVLQEGMIGLYKAIRDYQRGKLAGFRSFAETCVTRQIITATKMASRKKHQALNTSLSLDGAAASGNGEMPVPADLAPMPGITSPEQIVLNQIAARDLGHRMKVALSDLERVALRAYLTGRSYHEIAGELNMSSKQIDNALQRAKRKMKRRLREQTRAVP